MMATFMNWQGLTDEKGRTWWMMQREDGSVSVYYTRDGIGIHWVVYDDLDKHPEYDVKARAALEAE